ncbi:hypothetical protein TRV_03263 [Trichophyton verrucosum HKI 0517]|uniref:Uncharacterized protein n=1 Tax=Trichophyton verrucosum (strain HKI 0517) TaxID=663202 RepID=D4D828_TRIVH|nr:uncharacterized protein TRV_03263 [Trichophyton verrucosum HKI 0517]EFE41988.1 hypothetical protein TRV_03263 [Trichophyton verrucosum HKI 0517]
MVPGTSQIYEGLLRCVSVPSTPSDWNITFWLSPWGRRAEPGREKGERRKKKKRNESLRLSSGVFLRFFFLQTGLVLLTYDGLSALYDDNYDSRTKDEGEKEREKKPEAGVKGSAVFLFLFFLPFHPPLVLSVNNRHARPSRMREMDAQ